MSPLSLSRILPAPRVNEVEEWKGEHPMKTYKRGNLTESIILNAYIQAGFLVSVPFGTGGAYDLVVDTGSRLLRVQAKTGWLSRGCICYTSRRKAGSTQQSRRKYTSDEIDYFIIHCPANQAPYVVPSTHHVSEGRLRLEGTKNRQRSGIRWAADHSWDRHIRELFEE